MPPQTPLRPERRPYDLRFWLVLGAIIIAVNTTLAIGAWAWWIWDHLPAVGALEKWQPEQPLRIYANNGQLLQAVGPQLRFALPLKKIPKEVQDAFTAAENAQFYSHNPLYYPVSYPGIVRAALVDLIHMAPVQGASTITEQVARNFYLSPKKTITRKVAEIFLAYKLAARLTHKQILDLYLNKIYLGQGAYGIGAAARTYYGKSVEQLSLSQAATLAGLPAAPSAFNPIQNPPLARKRRDYVLYRMLVNHDITHREFIKAEAEPVRTRYHTSASDVAPYATEWIRKWLEKTYGANFTYRRGLRVYTTISPKDQRAADVNLAIGLENYAMGLDSLDPKIWQGPITHLKGPALANAVAGQRPSQIGGRDPANLRWGVVIQADAHAAQIRLEGRRTVTLSLKDVEWAHISPTGATPTAVDQVLNRGDVVWLRHYVAAASVGTGNIHWAGTNVWRRIPDAGWQLTVIPHAQGALVSLNARTGAILALRGGFSYELSHFDRALYAYRQPGSGFKPFVYAAALDGKALKAAGNSHYLTPVSPIKDTPLAVKLPDGTIYQPTNYSNTFSSTPIPIWKDLADSHNVPSVRLLLRIGIPYAAQYVQRFGFPAQQIPQVPSMVLGSGDYTPMQMTRAYATFANGGDLPTPYLISRIQTTDGHHISLRDCPLGYVAPQQAAHVIPSGVAFLLTRMMEHVIRDGTGVAAQILHRHDLAGKTGTTNHENNTWFMGYNPKIVTTVWVGYDNNQGLGRWAAGAREALPIWIHFMKTALKGEGDLPFSVPPTVVRRRYDPKTGGLTDHHRDSRKAYFLKNYLPTEGASGFGAIKHLLYKLAHFLS